MPKLRGLGKFEKAAKKGKGRIEGCKWGVDYIKNQNS